MSDKQKEIPVELLEGRSELECCFIGCLWQDPTLFDEYGDLNIKGDKDLLTEDGIFYYGLGRLLYKAGYVNFDNITVAAYLEKFEKLKDEFNKRGGYSVILEIEHLTDIRNFTTYYSEIQKSNMLIRLHQAGFNVLEHLSELKYKDYTEIYNWIEEKFDGITTESNCNIEVEDLTISDKFIDDCNEGLELGFDYSKNCRILNSITMGIPKGDLTMIAGHSGSGKTSWIFENIILVLNEQNVKCAVISNEQRAKDFKLLLLAHVLTQDMGYWSLTRKRLKIGNFTDEELAKLKEAQNIIDEKYSDIKFIKLFDNDMGKVSRTIKRLARNGYEMFMFDTMKSEDSFNEAMWQQLLINSRKLFQLVSKENVALVASYQLALHTLNRRYLDASCLSNAKQIKEVFSEMIYIRELWQDEFSDGKYYVNPRQYVKKDSPNYDKNGIEQEIDPTKKYVIAFVDKTRNDETGQQVLYSFNGRFNNWKEIGKCTVLNDHKI